MVQRKDPGVRQRDEPVPGSGLGDEVQLRVITEAGSGARLGKYMHTIVLEDSTTADFVPWTFKAYEAHGIHIGTGWAVCKLGGWERIDKGKHSESSSAGRRLQGTD